MLRKTLFGVTTLIGFLLVVSSWSRPSRGHSRSCQERRAGCGGRPAPGGGAAHGGGCGPRRRGKWRSGGAAQGARAAGQRAEGANLPLQGPAEPAQGDRAPRGDRGIAGDHQAQERDGQHLPAGQAGLRGGRQAGLLQGSGRRQPRRAATSSTCSTAASCRATTRSR